MSADLNVTNNKEKNVMKENLHIYSILLTEEHGKKLEQIAAALDRPKSYVIRKLIENTPIPEAPSIFKVTLQDESK